MPLILWAYKIKNPCSAWLLLQFSIHSFLPLPFIPAPDNKTTHSSVWAPGKQRQGRSPDRRLALEHPERPIWVKVAHGCKPPASVPPHWCITQCAWIAESFSSASTTSWVHTAVEFNCTWGVLSDLFNASPVSVVWVLLSHCLNCWDLGPRPLTGTSICLSVIFVWIPCMGECVRLGPLIWLTEGSLALLAIVNVCFSNVEGNYNVYHFLQSFINVSQSLCCICLYCLKRTVRNRKIVICSTF